MQIRIRFGCGSGSASDPDLKHCPLVTTGNGTFVTDKFTDFSRPQFKGTQSQDFLLLFFLSCNLSGVIHMLKYCIFAYGPQFAEIVTSAKNSAMSMTLWSYALRCHQHHGQTAESETDIS